MGNYHGFWLSGLGVEGFRAYRVWDDEPDDIGAPSPYLGYKRALLGLRFRVLWANNDPPCPHSLPAVLFEKACRRAVPYAFWGGYRYAKTHRPQCGVLHRVMPTSCYKPREAVFIVRVSLTIRG